MLSRLGIKKPGAVTAGWAFAVLLSATPATANSASREALIADIADDVFARFQLAREAAGLAPVSRLPALDGVARARAERIAALPHAERLTVADPVADEVRDAGIVRYRRVDVHLDMQRGFADPAAAFERNWVRHPSWGKAQDPRYEIAGLGVGRGDDGWLVLVVVLVDPLDLPTDLPSLELRVAVLINEQRARDGLPELAYSQRLAAIAGRHSDDMARNDFFDHTAPDGRVVGERVRDAGESYRIVAENIYRVRGSEHPAADAIAAWMKSPGHRKNIMNDACQFTGVGIAVDSAGNIYFTQVFLKP